MSCSRANVQTSLSVQSASGLTFSSFLPEGSGKVSMACRFARVGDCTRRKSSEPDIVVCERRKERTHFAQLAALIRLGLIQNAEFGFLLGHGPLGHHVHQVQP